ncbi:hypothetical protein HMI55_005570 [Coelomomyces lativittatus]|nr:hypothetical protein HMI55_005570 [Coelomomyces lativittatus]
MGKIPLIGDIIGEGTEVTKLEQLNNLSLKDIMIPLPGHSVVYPSNTKNEYKRLLETDGLTLETFQAMKDWYASCPLPPTPTPIFFIPLLPDFLAFFFFLNSRCSLIF